MRLNIYFFSSNGVGISSKRTKESDNANSGNEPLNELSIQNSSPKIPSGSRRVIAETDRLELKEWKEKWGAMGYCLVDHIHGDIDYA